MTDYYHFKNILRLSFLTFSPAIIFLFILSFTIQGCVSTGGYQEAEFMDDSDSQIKIYGLFDKEYTNTYFGSFRFVFENECDQWLTLENIRLSFSEDSAQKYINVLDQVKLKRWAAGVRLQKNIKESTVKDLQSALISAGSSISGIVGDLGEKVGLEAGEKKISFPENHLYAEEFILPPGFVVEKWVLLESSHHERIPYVTSLNLDLEVNEIPQQACLQFREESSTYKNFFWYDPTRKIGINYFLGISAGSVFPMGAFKSMAKRKENLINTFSINAYMSLLNNFGINFALGYQSFQSRAKLPFEPDSLFNPLTEFEFNDWENYLFTVSPRFVFPVSVDVDIFTEVSAGLAFCLSPTIIQKRGGLETGELEGSSKLALIGGAAVGSRFYLTEKLNLDIKIEFIPFLNPTFSYEIDNKTTREIKQNMSHY